MTKTATDKNSSRKIPLSGLIGLFSIITILMSIITLFADDHQKLEMFTHFKLQYLLGSILFSSIYLYARKYLYSAILAVAIIVNTVFILPWYFAPALIPSESNIVATSKSSIKLLHLNLLSSNTQHANVIEVISKENPNIIILQEVSFLWANKIQPLLKTYPFHKIIARNDNFGIAVLSKIELNSIEIKDWGETGGLPGLLLNLKINNTPIQLASLHPLPPLNKIYYDQRNKSLDAVQKDISRYLIPSILVGDFNISMWSPNYQNLEADGRLYNARKGFGINTTWPALLGPLGIPIDHILVSPEFTVVDFYTGPNVGSDHLPLIAVLQLNVF